MAALADVSVLLLDEHTAALDPRTAEYVLKVTEEIVGKKKPTTIMITHSMAQALQYGSRTIMLDEGRVALNLGPEDRKGLTVTDLLEKFRASANASINEDGCCQTNENSHRTTGAALIYALISWRHSVRAAVRLILKLSRE
ncbi:hypothetical protein N9V38_04305 [Planktomarina temperata]|nr:hypothetical protein [Planktomarina temperata]